MRVKRRSDPSKFQQDYNNNNTTNTYPLGNNYSSFGRNYDLSNLNNDVIGPTSSLSSYYLNNTTEENNNEDDKEYFREEEANSFLNSDYVKSRNSIWNDNDDQKPSKTNINVRIPFSSNNRTTQNNSRYPRRISKIPTIPRNPTMSQNNQNNQNNHQTGLTVQQLHNLLQTHAQTVNAALQNQNTNLQNFFNGINLPGGNGERNHVKIQFFRGNDDEDPIEWIESFERACEANNIQDNRKVAIAAAYLKDMAGDWYERDRNNINQWYQQGANNNFKSRFIEAFSSRVRRDRWNDALENIKQGPNESVDNYVIRFRIILKRADPNSNIIGEETKIRRFRAGLLNIIKPFAMMGGVPQTLEEMIERAKQAEFGVQQMNEGQTVTAIQPTTNQIFQKQTTIQPTPNNNDKMDDLINMMSQMQIKMMDLDNNKNRSNYNRNQQNRYSNRRNYNDQRSNNNNNRNRNENRDINCWTCGKDGHKSPDCPNRGKRDERRNNRSTNSSNERAMNYFNRYNNHSKKNNYESDESEWEDENEREIYVAAKRKNIANNSFGTKKFKHDQISSESQKERDMIDGNTKPSWQKALEVKAAKTMCKICNTMGHFTRRCPNASEEQKQKMSRTKTGNSRITSLITKDVSNFNMIEHIKNLPCGMSIGQACKFVSGYRNDFFKIMKRKRVEGLNFLDKTQSVIPTTAMKCEGIIEGLKVPIIIDTGAANSAISEKLADKLGYTADEKSNIILVTANGTKERSLGKINNVEILLGQQVKTKANVEIVQSNEEMILLGMDWMRKVKAIISTEDNWMSIKIGNTISEIPVKYTMDDDDEDDEEEYGSEYETEED